MPESLSGPQTPSLFLGLVDLSEGMARRPVAGQPRPFASAGRLLDRVVEALVRRYDGPDRPAVDLGIALLGYRSGPDGRTIFRSLLPGSRIEGREWLNADEILSPPPEGPNPWVPASRLGQRPALIRPGAPRRWAEIDPTSIGGEASPSEALRLANRLIMRWLRYQLRCAPPMVVHCGAHREPDDTTALLTRSIAGETEWGPVGVIHCLFGGDGEPSGGSRPNDGRFLDLWEASSPLPPDPKRPGIAARRGLTSRHWPVGSILRKILEPTKAAPSMVCPAPAPSTSGMLAPVERVHVLASAKEGKPEESQDSHATDAEAGNFVVTDGASQGFAVKSWARILAQGFIEARPDLEDPAVLASWLQECRVAWRQTFDIHNLRYAQLELFERHGGAATLAGLAVGVPAEDGSIPWRAWAIGDACLFQVREGRVCLSFPFADPELFSDPPVTLRTKTSFAQPRPLVASGHARPGDLLVLATDAVSHWIVTRTLAGETIEWDDFWGWDLAEWSSRVEAYRKTRPFPLKIDDNTLMLIRLSTPLPIESRVENEATPLCEDVSGSSEGPPAEEEG